MIRRSVESRTPDFWALAALLSVTAFTVLGFWTFGLHPERIPPTPSAGAFYAFSFQLFGQGHLLAAFSVLAFVLTRQPSDTPTVDLGRGSEPVWSR